MLTSVCESLSDDNVLILLSGCQTLALQAHDVCMLCLGKKDASRYKPNSQSVEHSVAYVDVSELTLRVGKGPQQMHADHQQ